MEVSGQLHALPLYPWGKKPWYPLDRMLDGFQSWSRCCGVEKNLLPQPGIKPQLSILQPVTILTGSDYIASNDTRLMNDLERRWKDAAMVYFKVYLCICLERPRKTPIRIADVPAEI
jgi:hypothetical protein